MKTHLFFFWFFLLTLLNHMWYIEVHVMFEANECIRMKPYNSGKHLINHIYSWIGLVNLKKLKSRSFLHKKKTFLLLEILCHKIEKTQRHILQLYIWIYFWAAATKCKHCTQISAQYKANSCTLYIVHFKYQTSSTKK